MKKYCYILFLIITCFNAKAGTAPKCIYTQKQFDEAVARINRGEEVHIVLHRGDYLLKESLIATAPVSIEGRKAVITSAQVYNSKEAVKSTDNHKVFKIKRPISNYPLFYDEQHNIIPVSESVQDNSGVNYLDGDIISEGENTVGAHLKLPIPASLSHLKKKTFNCAFGYFDCGWSVVDFRLDKADSKYLYCTTLNRCSTNNYMYDKKAYMKKVRLVVYNAEMKKDRIYYDSEYLYVPKQFTKVYNVNEVSATQAELTISFYSDVILRKITFVGYSNIKVEQKKGNVCLIEKCYFEKSSGSALLIKKENGAGVRKAVITNCDFYECGLHNGAFVQISTTFGGSPCVEVNHCTMTRYPTGWAFYKNSGGGVWVDGDVNICNNVIYNTCRNHIYFHAGKIEAKGNVLYNTDGFNAKADRNLSGDWGLIYCDHLYTKTDDAIKNKEHRITLENNLLYGAYAYGGDARGIFIDDGRGDVTCRNNVILNTQVYSIDARNSFQNAASVRNRYEGNIVTTRYRLAAGSEVKGLDKPVTRRNYVLSNEENVVANVEVDESDIRANVVAISAEKDGKIVVDKLLYDVIRKSPAWKSAKKYVKRK